MFRLLGKADDLHVQWKIPVDRPGWKAEVSVSLYRYSSDSRNEVSVTVHGVAWPDNVHGKYWLYTNLMGSAHSSRLTKKWITNILSERIETARLAALAATEADLRESGKYDWSNWSEEELRQEFSERDAYFMSTLESEA